MAKKGPPARWHPACYLAPRCAGEAPPIRRERAGTYEAHES